jgi:putative MATE family efflux protein
MIQSLKMYIGGLSMKDSKAIDFTKGNLSSNLLKIYIPLYIAYFCTTLYNIIGGLWVGNLLGEKAFAAQSTSVPLVMFFSAIVIGATNGVTIVLSKYLGAKDKEKVSSTLMISFISLFIFGLILTFGCLLNIDGILSALNTPKEIFGMARNYLFFCILSFPFIEIYMYLSAVLRSYGNVSLQMITIVITTILNIILDPILILQTGLNGAAIATLLSQIISVLIMTFYILIKKMFIFDLKSMNLKSLREIAKACIPSAIQQGIPTISTAVIQAMFSSFGVVALAAYGVASKLEVIVLYPALTINMSVATAVGTCYGAKQSGKIKEYFKWGIILSVCLDLVLTTLVTIFSPNMARMFGVSSGALMIIKRYFEIIAIGYVLNCITQSFVGELNGLQQQIKSMIFMAFYFIILRLPLAKILSSTALKIDGISMSISISFIVPAFIAIVYQYRVMNKIIQKESVEVEGIHSANEVILEVKSTEGIEGLQDASSDSDVH